jgi:hypothetical protein
MLVHCLLGFLVSHLDIALITESHEQRLISLLKLIIKVFVHTWLLLYIHGSGLTVAPIDLGSAGLVTLLALNADAGVQLIRAAPFFLGAKHFQDFQVVRRLG